MQFIILFINPKFKHLLMFKFFKLVVLMFSLLIRVINFGNDNITHCLKKNYD